MSVRIYTYGLPFGPDEEHRAIVDDQIFKARIYQNQLIAIERARRGAYRDIRRRHDPELERMEDEEASLTSQIAEVNGLIKAANAERRSRSVTKEHRARLKELKARRKQVRADLRERRKLFKDNEQAKADLKALEERANGMVKLHRAACGVYWGTYLLIEAAVKQASRKADPVHRRWNGNGRVGVQIQGGLPVAAAFGGDTRLQIDPVPPETYTGSRSQRRKLSRTKVRMRVGSNGRAPVWAQFSVILHRPMPKDGLIKWAWAQRRKVGTRWRWELQLVIESESWDNKESRGSGVCAIDIGWRLRRSENGLRVGYIVDEGGRDEELLLPQVILDKLAYSDHLRSINDRNFDEVRAQLSQWIEGRVVPAWLTERLKHMARWRSRDKLVRVVRRWATHRFGGDEEIFAVVESWRRQERHLYQWEASQRDKTLKRRREHYRLLATEICRRYDTVVLEDIDLRQLARRAEADEEESMHEAARLQRTRASLSEFRDALRLAASNNGARIVLVPAPHTTTECHVCKNDCSKDAGWNPADNLVHTCTVCGTKWDQDSNAAHNMLAAYRDGSSKSHAA